MTRDACRVEVVVRVPPLRKTFADAVSRLPYIVPSPFPLPPFLPSHPGPTRPSPLSAPPQGGQLEPGPPSVRPEWQHHSDGQEQV